MVRLSGAQARAALRRFGNDVEMACQALLSAGALEGEGAAAAAGGAGDEQEHEHVAGTSEDARGEHGHSWRAGTNIDTCCHDMWPASAWRSSMSWFRLTYR